MISIAVYFFIFFLHCVLFYTVAILQIENFIRIWHLPSFTSSFSSVKLLAENTFSSCLRIHLYFPWSLSTTFFTVRICTIFELCRQYLSWLVLSLIAHSAPALFFFQYTSFIGFSVLAKHSISPCLPGSTKWRVFSMIAVSTILNKIKLNEIPTLPTILTFSFVFLHV